MRLLMLEMMPAPHLESSRLPAAQLQYPRQNGIGRSSVLGVFGVVVDVVGAVAVLTADGDGKRRMEDDGCGGVNMR